MDNNPDVIVPSRGGHRNSKVQFEQQQHAVRAPRSFWDDIVYPGRSESRPFYHASMVEIVAGLIAFVISILVVIRTFTKDQYSSTPVDTVSFWLFSITTGVIAFTIMFACVAWATRRWRESNIYILPNGYPVTYETIRANYEMANTFILDRQGYFDVEGRRADNPIVAPGEISNIHSPSYTYAPSSTREAASNDLQQMLSMPTDEEDSDANEITELPDMLDFFEHIDIRENGKFLIGKDERDNIIQIPIARLLNHLVGGAIGTGKSIYLRSLVFQLLLEAEETAIKIGLADIENNTFPEFAGCSNVEWYASNYFEIEQMTTSLLNEVEHRKQLYEAIPGGTPKDIDRYNTMARRAGVDELPFVVIVYDEFSALMHKSQTKQKQILSDILQLALRARKYGIFLIIAGQTFKADLVDSAFIGQFNVSIGFKMRNVAQSMSIIGQPGLEKLKHPGEAFMKSKDGQIVRLQTFFIDDDKLFDALETFKTADAKPIVPPLVRQIVHFSYEALDNKVPFKNVEMYFKEKDIGRAEVMKAFDWADEHKFFIRAEKNARVLNLPIVKQYIADLE